MTEDEAKSWLRTAVGTNPTLKVGDRIRMEIEGEVITPRDDGADLLLTSGHAYFGPTTLAAAKITVLPPEWKVGMTAIFGGQEWDIAAGPLVRDDGVSEVALWHKERGFYDAETLRLERLP